MDANRAPEDADLADILDACKNPGAITLDSLIQTARNEGRFQFCDWLSERKNRRVIPHRLESAGYVPVRNDAAKDGLWKLDGRRQADNVIPLERALVKHKVIVRMGDGG